MGLKEPSVLITLKTIRWFFGQVKTFNWKKRAVSER
jgi:hypothetical protein